MYRFKLPENLIPKEAAYQIMNYVLLLDGNPRLSLASFVTTWMEPERDKLMVVAINMTYVDMDDFPITIELQVGWEKFARYYEVEPKEVKLLDGSRHSCGTCR